MDPVIVSMATMPSREDSFEDAVDSLLKNPIDKLNIYLNLYGDTLVDKWDDSRIEFLYSEDAIGDLADSGKFYWADEIEGYHLTADDDILYPSDYVDKIVEGIERYKRKAVVSFHGASIQSPIIRFYKNRTGLCHCAHALAKDTPVNLVGTGVMGYHTDTLAVHVNDFETPYMADIWMGIICQRQSVPQIVLAHDEDFITVLFHDPYTTIHAQFRTNDFQQARAVNTIKDWKFFDLP